MSEEPGNVLLDLIGKKKLILVFAIKLRYLENFLEMVGFIWMKSEDLSLTLQHLTSRKPLNYYWKKLNIITQKTQLKMIV